ncbi:MAG: hypothetical protein HN742_21840 [Lentisphaerae bacterium]|jgi:neutral ceramidase|nr:hypothetical protein [Lentisphaerota bacterium]MBT4817695.1 hypothetical protein [Lentisphaerota bacterium]MBT5608552.1 hypothetical protein [Lentisphaerota bacterium]MBT7058652.1 hypothetical protein [Lentisphaerota bacterium]MBT7844535.1 hypothetical protein [Lentisphaerota bacterium]
MNAGFFETDITPPVGMEKPGGYWKAYCPVRHDPCKVRAGVFDDGQCKVALVGIDTCVIAADTVAKARSLIETYSDLVGANVMIGASHTHCGGPLFGPSEDDLVGAPELIRDLALNHSTVRDPLYEEWAVRQITTAVVEANRRCDPVTLSIGTGQEDAAVFNRRLRMKSGRTCSHPGKGNPDIVDYAGPIDPDVGVVAAWRPDGSLAGCVVNYTCHGTTGPGGISADWIYYLDTTIAGAMGGRPVTVFLNGACGDVTQVNNLCRTERESGEKYARLIGGRVGSEAVKVMLLAERGDLGPVAAKTRILQIQRRPPSPASVVRSREIVEATTPAGAPSPEWIFAKERVVLDYMIRVEPVVDVEIQAIQIGPAVFLSNPAEYFCSMGLDIKAQSPFPFTYVVELANGGVGYVPNDEAFEKTGGGYETALTTYSNLVTDAGQQIVDASVALAKELAPGAEAQRPTVPPVTAVWGYGASGPDLD